MNRILIAGAGKIGSTIAHILATSGDYHVFLTDKDIRFFKNTYKLPLPEKLELHQLDIQDSEKAGEFITAHKIEAVISSLPYFCNIDLAKLAKQHQTHYFDLTEDTQVTQTIAELAKDANTAFVPQCGLAPGFVDIVANHLMKDFEELDTVKLRVGALPQNTSNALQYALTWSTDGLINEYGNPCDAVVKGEKIKVPPLDDLEEVQIDGLSYEAFNTSGGIGSLAETYAGKIQNLNYKTIRYPGHCEKMRFLMQGLKLNDDRETLKHILEKAIPSTKQDVVIVFVSATGNKNGQFYRESYVKKFYPKTVHGMECSAIQITTAAGICAVVDSVLKNPKHYHGWVRQEQFTLTDFLSNPFGQYYEN